MLIEERLLVCVLYTFHHNYIYSLMLSLIVFRNSCIGGFSYAPCFLYKGDESCGLLLGGQPMIFVQNISGRNEACRS